MFPFKCKDKYCKKFVHSFGANFCKIHCTEKNMGIAYIEFVPEQI